MYSLCRVLIQVFDLRVARADGHQKPLRTLTHPGPPTPVYALSAWNNPRLSATEQAGEGSENDEDEDENENESESDNASKEEEQTEHTADPMREHMAGRGHEQRYQSGSGLVSGTGAGAFRWNLYRSDRNDLGHGTEGAEEEEEEEEAQGQDRSGAAAVAVESAPLEHAQVGVTA